MVKTRKREAPALCGCCHSVESAFGEFLMRHLGQMLPTELMPLAEETIGKRCSARAFALRSVCDRIIKMVSASPSLNGRAIGEGHSKCLAYYCEA